MMKLQHGKLNIIIDGQFGSTGKGLLAQYVKLTNHIDIAVSNASANAGHSFYLEGDKKVSKHLPISGILSDRCQIYLCSGAIINPTILLYELEEFDIDPDRLLIHPRCAIITEEDLREENDRSSSYTKLASTQSGVGSALARKVQRRALLAKDINELRPFIGELDLHFYMDEGCCVLMEVPQGLDLSISSGLSYPHCTSREITVSSALTDAQVHPSYLGKVIVSLRTFPIRVGNIVEGENELGNSGQFYEDSEEIDWSVLGVDPERTTVTNRIRRVATFSNIQYKHMLNVLRPDYVFMNFCNYMEKSDLSSFLEELPEITHLGFGPKITDVTLNHI